MQILKDLYFLPFKGKKAHLKKKRLTSYQNITVSFPFLRA